MCHITDTVKQFPTKKTTWKHQDVEVLCQTHNEVLDLFCEKDLELLCPRCRFSPEHQSHHLISIEKAIVSQRKKFGTFMKILKNQIQDAEIIRAKQHLKSLEAMEKMENWKMELQPELEELKTFLKKQQVSINASLLMEEKEIEEKLNKHKGQILKYIFTLKNLLSDMTMKFLQNDMDLLGSIGDVDNQFGELTAPRDFSYEFRKERCSLPPHYFGLQRMISTFQVDLTLDPKTAHSSLSVSENKKSVMVRTSLPSLDNHTECVTYPAVFSSQGFEGGRNFWQVDIRGIGEWAVGLCERSISGNHSKLPIPKTIFWSSQQSESISNTQNNEQEQVERFGVFLDFELGEYSIYDLQNRTCLYKYSDVFTGKLIPYFAIRCSLKPFSISLVTEE